MNLSPIDALLVRVGCISCETIFNVFSKTKNIKENKSFIKDSYGINKNETIISSTIDFVQEGSYASLF